MRALARPLVVLGIFAGLLLGATASSVAARSAQQCGMTGSLRSPPTPRPHYALHVRVSPGLRVVTGVLTLTFTAPANHATDRLVFRLWPNGPRYAKTGAHLSVSRVRERRRTLLASNPNPTTLVISRPLAAGAQAVVSMDWRLAVPRESGLRIGREGSRALRLGSFFPLLAWDGGGWALDPPTRFRGETWTSPTADFDVQVSHPSGLRVVATGELVGAGRWRARAVRDFALALGHFTIMTARAYVPAPVRLTVATDVVPFGLTPRQFLQPGIEALERYSALYGPYPWPTYTLVAMADLQPLTGGLEYPTLVYVPLLDANAVPHETAHQWFYSLVGNNQARNPWLDEGLATWAEAAIHGPGPFPNAPIPPEVANKIGEPMSFWEQFSPDRLYLGVYLQSYRALLSLGPRSRIDCALRLYVLHTAYRNAHPRDLGHALQTFFPDAARKLKAYGAHF
jgi:Peptidase family M1 domain